MGNLMNSLNEGLENTISILEKAKRILDIINDTDDEPQAPSILSEEQALEIFNELEDPDSVEAYALKTYSFIADSYAAYANYLTENQSSSKREIIMGSIPYIASIYAAMSGCFDVFAEAKWNKYSSKKCIVGCSFLIDLICGENDLEEVYSFEFLSDVSELWEFIVGITDEIHNAAEDPLFGEFINDISPQLSQFTENAIGIFKSDSSPREIRKTSRMLKKAIRVTSKKLSNKFHDEAYLMYSLEQDN